MKNTIILSMLFCAILMSGVVVGGPPAGRDWKLTWSDEFNSSETPIKPDSSNWGYENGYVRNREEQYYTNNIRNAYCQNGYLNIEAHKHAAGTYPTGSETGQDGSISSTSIRSMGKRSFKFGYFEIKCRVDTQMGSWPAFWSLGNSGGWPDGGECDIMEYYTGKFLFNVAWWKTGDAQWTARWDGTKKYLTDLPAGWLDEFHIFAMEWDTTQVKLHLDGVLQNYWDSSLDDNGGGDTSTEGFQQPHYMLINQAIGGSVGGDTSNMVFPTTYEVDWVRVWQEDSSTYCGDGVCSDYEDACNCSDDCATVAIESTCDDGIDNDCDGVTDLDDPDCFDYDPPTPDPASFQSVPESAGSTSITMTATTATDLTGVEYYFKNISIPDHDSGWQGGETYTDSGLSEGEVYGYKVRYRDPSFNKTGFSPIEFVVPSSGGMVFSEDFESGGLGSNWVPNGDWNVITYRQYDGTYSIEIDGPVTDSALVSKAIDVSGALSATVDFAWYNEGGVDTGEYLAFDVSLDGGGWVELARLRGTADPENVWVPESHVIDVSVASTLELRFRGTMSGGNEDSYLDGIIVSAVASASSVTVPDVTGYDQSTAVKIVSAVDLTAGSVSSDHSETVGFDSVISQIPTAGSSASSGDPVAFTVSSGLLADLDGDDNVGLSDLLIVASGWVGTTDNSDLAGLSNQWLDSIGLPVGNWHFDGDASDETIKGWHGTLNGGASFITDATRGDCLSLDGIDSYVSIEEYEGVAGTDPRTFAAWVNVDVDGGDGVMVNWGDNTASGGKWRFMLSSGGVLRVSVTGGQISATTDLRGSGWHHVAVVFKNDGTPDVSDIKFYVDGTVDPIGSVSSIVIETIGDPAVSIGAALNGILPQQYFKGLMDDAAVYDRALSDAEIVVLAGL